MDSTLVEKLVAGFYWYLVPGKPPVICEKKDAEHLIFFTNGAHQAWIRRGDRLEDPLGSRPWRAMALGLRIPIWRPDEPGERLRRPSRLGSVH